MWSLRACGEPNKIKNNTHPGYITALLACLECDGFGDEEGGLLAVEELEALAHLPSADGHHAVGHRVRGVVSRNARMGDCAFSSGVGVV